MQHTDTETQAAALGFQRNGGGPSEPGDHVMVRQGGLLRAGLVVGNSGGGVRVIFSQSSEHPPTEVRVPRDELLTFAGHSSAGRRRG